MRAKIPPIVGIDGRSYVVYWGPVTFEIPADRNVHISVHCEGDAIVQAASALLPPGEASPSPTRPTTSPVAARSSDGKDDQAVRGRGPQDQPMTVATDTFADFVEHLAEALDDHEVTGEEWAGRLHFSRFHFDRMIKSVAGEPPQAFRRRILLERAAYRMISTSAPLIDIAVEAGYGSHEAFSRAFAKAYGATPAAWRKKPGHLQVDAPSNVHFHPPGSLRLPARDKVTSMDLLTKMVEHHIWLTGEMVRLAERLTDEQLDQRIELDVDDDHQTIRSLLSRLVGQMGMWNAAMATRDYDWSVEEHESLSSLRERFATEAPTYLAHVRGVVAADRLDDTFVDALCEPAEVFTYGGMIAHVLTFAAHRRTLVALAFARHGIEDLGWGDPMTWVARPA